MAPNAFPSLGHIKHMEGKERVGFDYDPCHCTRLKKILPQKTGGSINEQLSGGS